MKKIVLLAFAFIVAFADVFAQSEYREVSGIYCGGHIRRGRPGTITKLRNSGFTYVILFNVDVKPDGTLTTDGDTICYRGEYVFQKTNPYYQQDIANLKTEPTSITRVEICIGGWGNGSYGNIRNLINANGTGTNTMLYKNFRALKQAVPEIDAVNNDTEQDYDADSAAKFHLMMYRLGYKTTFAPYTAYNYWTSLNNKIRAQEPDAVDRVMVQCYDGGAYNLNQVGSWNFTGVSERHPGLLDYSNDWSVERNLAQFQSWKDEGVATGGFVWLYNDGYDETWDLNGWAAGLNRIYGAVTVPEDQVVVRLYSEKNFKGYCVSLPPGQYCQGDLAVYGMKAKDISSVEIVDDCYQVILYKGTDCKGSRITKRASSKSLTTNYDNQICSVVVEPNPTGINEIGQQTTDHGQQTTDNGQQKIYNVAGQRLQKMQKGINIVNGKKRLY